MTSILFLLGAVGLSVVGCSLFLLRQRKPTSLEHGIEAFRRQMQALSPVRDPGAHGQRGSRPSPPLAGGRSRRR